MNQRYLLIPVAVFLYLNFSLALAVGDYVLPATGGTFLIFTLPGQGSHSSQPNLNAYDIAIPGGRGTAVAVSAGEVVTTYKEREGGNCAIVEHSNGFSQYCHLDSFSVKPGDPVSRGDPIGAIGSTGISEGPHLHFSWVASGTPGAQSAPAPSELNSIIRKLDVNTSGGVGNPGTISPNPVNPNDLNLGEIGKLVGQFYQYALMIGGLLALAIIVYGGVMYIASPGNESLKSDAKEWIKAAIFGLILLALAYLILNTINPCFVGGPTCPSQGIPRA